MRVSNEAGETSPRDPAVREQMHPGLEVGHVHELRALEALRVGEPATDSGRHVPAEQVSEPNAGVINPAVRVAKVVERVVHDRGPHCRR